MWLIPLTYRQYSAFAPELMGSKEALSELSDPSISLPMLRSKPSSSQTYLRAWNRIYWIPLLFGRMLKPSTQSRLEGLLTESLEVIRANRSVQPVAGGELMTRGTCGLILDDIYEISSLIGVFSRTSGDILVSDTVRSDVSWKKWVTQLGKESMRRRKSVRLIREKGYLSSQSDLNWATHPHTGDKIPTDGNIQKREAVNREWQRQSFDRTIGSGKTKLGNANRQGLQSPICAKQPSISGTAETFPRSEFSRAVTTPWPAGQGIYQYEWEEPRTIEPRLGCTVNGYNYRTDFLRALGNSVVKQTAVLAFTDLLRKHYG